MSESRKKKSTTPTSSSSSSSMSQSSFISPGGDTFERILTTPKESLIQRAASPRRTIASPLKTTVEICLDQLPKLSECNIDLREKLIESKIGQCSLLCQFEAIPLDSTSAYSSTDILSSSSLDPSNDSSNFVSPIELRNREIKRKTLLELIELVNERNRPIPDSLYPQFFQMIFRNLFRPIPPPLNPTGDAFDPSEDEPVLEPSWPHLQLIYELFIRFIESPDFNGQLARKFIDSTFIIQLLALFDVEDPRERDLLKTTLHRIYAKFLQLRSFIRKSIHNIFYEFVADSTEYRHNISEMLEILGSIINGFALPLKDEHKIFLERTLLPLHKTRYLSLYFRQLHYCIVQFVEKDSSQSVPIIFGLLRIWPKTNSTKEVMFLTEIEEILDIMPVEQFRIISQALFKQISKCIDSNHFQVAERALMLWHNEYITTSLIPDQFQEIISITLPVLSKHSKSHWNRNVQILILNALECFMTIDPLIFDSCVATLPEIEAKSLDRRRRLFKCWKALDNLNISGNIESENDFLAQKQLYSLSKEAQGEDDDDDDETEEFLDNSNDPNNQSPKPKEISLSRSNAILTRRKSILPVDLNVYQELVDYSRSSSPRPEENETDMKE